VKVIIHGDLKHVQRVAKLLSEDGERVYREAKVGYGWGFRSLDGMSFFVRRTKTGLSVQVTERKARSETAGAKND
jgi:hypothetical protein